MKPKNHSLILCPLLILGNVHVAFHAPPRVSIPLHTSEAAPLETASSW